jgi:hypothetical protein
MISDVNALIKLDEVELSPRSSSWNLRVNRESSFMIKVTKMAPSRREWGGVIMIATLIMPLILQVKSLYIICL